MPASPPTPEAGNSTESPNRPAGTSPDMTYDDALEYLKKHAANGESWFDHSVACAGAAGRIADALAEKGVEADPERVRICALFHDIGRSLSHGHLHGWSGWELLSGDGLECYGKSCISHWLKGRSIDETISEAAALDEEFVRHVFEQTGCGEFTIEEKIVSLADSMTSFDKIVSVGDRYSEARSRYADSDWLSTNERISEETKAEFDAILGFDLYDLFPEIKK